MFLAPSSSRAIDPYLQTLLLRDTLSRLGGKHRHYLTHMLAVVKSYWPQHNLSPVALGIAIDCSDQDFLGYCKETETIAEEILKNLAE